MPINICTLFSECLKELHTRVIPCEIHRLFDPSQNLILNLFSRSKNIMKSELKFILLHLKTNRNVREINNVYRQGNVCENCMVLCCHLTGINYIS